MRAPYPGEPPHDAKPEFLLNAALLLYVTDMHKWSTWDKVSFWMAVFNVVFFVFRLVRRRRYDRALSLWLESR